MTEPTLRLRKRPFVEIIQNLDAFSKVQESVQEEKHFIGAAIFLACSALIGWLVVSEFSYYSATKLDYRFSVDTEHDNKLEINVDIVVAMPCSAIGVDVMDATDRPLLFSENEIKLDPYEFEMSEMQQQFWNAVRAIRKKVKPKKFSTLDNLLFVSADNKNVFDSVKKESENGDEKSDQDGDEQLMLVGDGLRFQLMSVKNAHQKENGCRVHGYARVNKVSGNLHITAGKSLPIVGGGHLHLASMGSTNYNFSHRIQRLSFGRYVNAMLNPLDGAEQITENPLHLYQYYAQVVPTFVHTKANPRLDTCQYSVTQRHRAIDHSHGSHGMPGIYIKYDLTAIKVDVIETRRSYIDFLVRMCAIVGGIFATSGIIHMITSSTLNFVVCLFTKSTGRDDGGVSQQFMNGGTGDRQHGEMFVT